MSLKRFFKEEQELLWILFAFTTFQHHNVSPAVRVLRPLKGNTNSDSFVPLSSVVAFMELLETTKVLSQERVQQRTADHRVDVLVPPEKSRWWRGFPKKASRTSSRTRLRTTRTSFRTTGVWFVSHHEFACTSFMIL